LYARVSEVDDSFLFWLLRSKFELKAQVGKAYTSKSYCKEGENPKFKLELNCYSMNCWLSLMGMWIVCERYDFYDNFILE
jgi:hypothetical protein